MSIYLAIKWQHTVWSKSFLLEVRLVYWGYGPTLDSSEKIQRNTKHYNWDQTDCKNCRKFVYVDSQPPSGIRFGFSDWFYFYGHISLIWLQGSGSLKSGFPSRKWNIFSVWWVQSNQSNWLWGTSGPLSPLLRFRAGDCRQRLFETHSLGAFCRQIINTKILTWVKLRIMDFRKIYVFTLLILLHVILDRNSCSANNKDNKFLLVLILIFLQILWRKSKLKISWKFNIIIDLLGDFAPKPMLFARRYKFFFKFRESHVTICLNFWEAVL